MIRDLMIPEGLVRGIGNCGIVAISAVANISIDKTTNLYKKTYKPQGNWKGSTHYHERTAILDTLGVNFEEIELKNMTLRTFIKNISSCNPDNIYIVTTTGHVQTVKGTKVLDQGGIFDISKRLKHGRKRLSRPVIKIT